MALSPLPTVIIRRFNWLPVWSAVHTGDMAAAEAALANIRDARRRWLGDEATAYRAAWRASIAAVDEKELEAAMALARGDDAAAEALLVEATVLEGNLNAPMGPPFPMKSAYEMYGEFLLARDRGGEAAAQFASALERMPNRTRSVRGLDGRNVAERNPRGRPAPGGMSRSSLIGFEDRHRPGRLAARFRCTTSTTPLVDKRPCTKIQAGPVAGRGLMASPDKVTLIERTPLLDAFRTTLGGVCR